MVGGGNSVVERNEGKTGHVGGNSTGQKKTPETVDCSGVVLISNAGGLVDYSSPSNSFNNKSVSTPTVETFSDFNSSIIPATFGFFRNAHCSDLDSPS